MTHRAPSTVTVSNPDPDNDNNRRPANVGARGGAKVAVSHLKLWRDTFYTIYPDPPAQLGVREPAAQAPRGGLRPPPHDLVLVLLDDDQVVVEERHPFRVPARLLGALV